MTELNNLHGWGEEIRNQLKLKTQPVAIKLLGNVEDIPPGANRPLKDMGYHLSLCQAFSMARREGATIAMLKEDMWCFLPVIGFGLAEPPQAFFDGEGIYPRTMPTPEAAKNMAQAFPRLKAGKYTGIVSAPLRTANFQPDLVTIYCDPSQLRLLLMARIARDGQGIAPKMFAYAACVEVNVPALLEGECQVAVPCAGDQRRAMAQDDELIFTAPVKHMEDLIHHLRFLDKQGYRIPMALTLKPEYELNESYVKMGKLVGMDWVSGKEKLR